MMNSHVQRSQRKALTVVVISAILSGCSALTPEPPTWRVAANYRVTNAGTSTELGYTALARQYEGERRWREARDTWRKAALAAPEDADILNALGLTEASQGQYGKAVDVLRRAVALAPERAQLLNNLGYALLLNGQSVEAKSVLQAALAHSPDHRLARTNLDRIDQVAGDASPRSIDDSLPLPLGQASIPASHLQTSPNVETLQLRQADIVETPGVKSAVVAGLSSLALAAEAPVRARKVAPPRIEIANGNGITGMAGWLGGWLRTRGLVQNARLSNVRPFNTTTTVVHYRVGYFTVAHEIAERMPQRVELAPAPGDALNTDIRIVLGYDFRAGVPCLRNCPAYSTTPTSTMARL